MKLEHLKEHYFFELNRKQQLEGALALPVAVLTGLGGVAFSFAQSFHYAANVRCTAFISALSGITICLGLSFYFIVRASFPFKYSTVPSPQELLTYVDSTKQYYRSLNESELKADRDFETEIKKAYAEATTTNALNNRTKAANLYKANLALIAAVVFLAISAIPYFIDARMTPKAVQKIEVTNLKD